MPYWLFDDASRLLYGIEAPHDLRCMHIGVTVRRFALVGCALDLEEVHCIFNDSVLLVTISQNFCNFVIWYLNFIAISLGLKKVHLAIDRLWEHFLCGAKKHLSHHIILLSLDLLQLLDVFISPGSATHDVAVGIEVMLEVTYSILTDFWGDCSRIVCLSWLGQQTWVGWTIGVSIGRLEVLAKVAWALLQGGRLAKLLGAAKCIESRLGTDLFYFILGYLEGWSNRLATITLESVSDIILA